MTEETSLYEMMKRPEFGLDAGIQGAVVLLCKAGVETHQSCEGGAGHSYPEPTVEFTGDNGAGLHALSVCVSHNLPVQELCRVWKVDEHNQIHEFMWRIVFWKKVYLEDVGGIDNEAEADARHQAAVTTWAAFVDKTHEDNPHNRGKARQKITRVEGD